MGKHEIGVEIKRSRQGLGCVFVLARFSLKDSHKVMVGTIEFVRRDGFFTLFDGITDLSQVCVRAGSVSWREKANEVASRTRL